jgi:Flp pilus assembly protein TadD
VNRRCLVVLLALSGCATVGEKGAFKEPDPLSLRKQLARELIAHREWAAASKPLLELVRLTPGDFEVREMLASAYREQGLYEEAMSEYDEAIALEPRYAPAYGGRGVLREVRGDTGDETLKDFEKAISLDPTNPVHHNNLGFALYLRGRHTDAIKAYRGGLRNDPTARRIHNNLGFAYGQLGHYQRARTEFERGGSPAVAANNLGQVLEQGGELKEACTRYQTAVLLDQKLEAATTNAARTCAGQPETGVAR